MARDFDGSAESLEHSNNAIYNTNNGDFTVMIWNKNPVEPAQEDRLFTKGSTSSAGSGNGKRYEVIWSTAADTLIFSIDDDTDKTNSQWASASIVYNGDWHCWIFERDASTHTKIFEGSTERATNSDSTGDIDDTGSNMYIMGGGGSDGVTDGEFWDGQCYYYTLFKRILPSVVKAALNRGVNPFAVGGAAVIYPVDGNNSPENSYLAELPISINSTPLKINPNPGVELIENYI